ncbi:peroxisomal membrane protein PEX14 isoform X2 [Senna tora]|uniref:Peroxisomal membrane protein PEX14 n=1 Tax=Senna tora TaxID=362788 RepID=A0A834X5V2_9FABA|nr:peroxisomal membrane protein PEX14 isoform X2 [Senna tora]
MASNQSVPPPNASDEKFQNPGDKSMQSTTMDQQNSIEEPVKQSSTSVFVNSEPMREEQVQNAVKFLSHPRVRGSPIIYRRSFLEKKGLTKEEIDEAFRRVPDSHPDTAGENKDGQLKSSSNIQPQAQAQALQPGASASTGTTTLATVSRSRFHWSHAFIAIGFLAASGAGTVVLIKFDLFGLSLTSLSEIMLHLLEINSSMVKILDTQGRRYFGELVTLVDNQVQEMKLMTNAIRRLEASSGATSLEQDRRVTQPTSKQQIANGKVDYDLHSGRNSSTPASAEPSTAPPHPKSYMEASRSPIDFLFFNDI